MVKIDIFSHILTTKYFEEFQKRATSKNGFSWGHLANPALIQLDIRFRVMDKYSDVLQVLTVATPPLETLVNSSDATELAKIANDEMAELVIKYPDKFVAAVACLPLNDIDAAIAEADRAITQLKFRGIQLFTNINGEALDATKFRPLYERMAYHDLPIWIHPWDLPIIDGVSQEWVKGNLKHRIGWPFETTLTMARLALSGIFKDYPNIKFITHHCGGMVPFFAKRMRIEELSNFYADTAVHANAAALMCGYEYFGPDHLLFGTDMPLGSTVQGGYGYTLDTIRSIEELDIPPMDKEKIFEGNARKLLKLPPM